MSHPPSPPTHIIAGYQTGLIARITQMHALHYAAAAGFGRTFEAVVARGLAEFSHRLDRPGNQVWTAVREGHILGAIAIDGEDLGEGVAHLRWFIVDAALRGQGQGQKLLDTALAFTDAQGFRQTHLWTFSGLDAARHLYESRGFALVEQWQGSQWGTEVTEQRFARVRPPA